MSEKSNISWTDSTASPWFVCTEVSPGCLNCYARTLTEQKFAFVAPNRDPLASGVVRRAYFKAGFADWATRPVWGDKATRVLSKGFWTDVVKWDKEAAEAGKRLRVFPSLMDWLDDFPAGVIDQDGHSLSAAAATARFLDLVRRTPNIEWLLLTKRIKDFNERVGDVAAIKNGDTPAFACAWLNGFAPPNVSLGVSVEDQTRADQRREEFRAAPAARKFVSYEPALGYVSWEGWEFADQIIAGGESGKDRRPCEVHWFEKTAAFCDRNKIKFFMKQDGALLPGQQGRVPASLWARKETMA